MTTEPLSATEHRAVAADQLRRADAMIERIAARFDRDEETVDLVLLHVASAYLHAKFSENPQ